MPNWSTDTRICATLRRAIVHIAVAAMLLIAVPTAALLVRLPDGTIAHGCGNASGLVHEHLETAAKPATRRSSQHWQISPSGEFRIHYDATGDHAVPAHDTNLSGVPDWVELVAHLADSIRQVYYDLGYTRPLGDPGGPQYGGGPEYDIYLMNLAPQHVYGLTWPGVGGYMQLDNDYAESIYMNRGATGLRVTIAHELFHSVQFTYYYGGNEILWWQEATATFMEDVVFPNINDYWQYLNPNWFQNTFFEDPSVPLNHSSGGRDVHMYGASVFCHFLDQNYPGRGHDAIRYTFERQKATNSGSINVVVGALQDQITEPMKDMLATFWAWSYFTGSRTRPGLFCEDAAGYSYPPPNALDESEWIERWVSMRHVASGEKNIPGLGAHMVSVVPDGSPGGVRIDLATVSGNSANWAYRLAVADDDTVRIYEPVDSRFEVGNWSTTTDIVLTAANGGTETATSTFRYTIEYDSELTRPALERFRLEVAQNAPNPFNPVTRIPFTLSEPADVSVVVYDLVGRQIRTITGGETFAEGDHFVTWDGTSDTGVTAGNGVYFARFRARDLTSTIRMVLLR